MNNSASDDFIEKIVTDKLRPFLEEKWSVETIQEMRLKDIERIAYCVTFYSVPSNEAIYDSILAELGSPRRAKEIQRYPQVLTITLRHLLLVQVYPFELIWKVMDPKFIISAYGSNPKRIGVEYLILNQSIEIEVPGYSGPRLDSKVINFLSKNYSTDDDSVSTANRYKESILAGLNNLFKTRNAAHLYRILPHFVQTDIVICLDDQHNASSSIQKLSNVKTLIKYIPDILKREIWIVFIVATTALVIWEKNTYSGSLIAKKRQLEKIGYKTVVITFNEWDSLKTQHDRGNYLKSKISECVHSHLHERNQKVLLEGNAALPSS